jgi:hypothetical protein
MSTAEKEFIHFRHLKLGRTWIELLPVPRRYSSRNLTDLNLICPQARTLFAVVVGSWGLSFWFSVRPLVWRSANCKICTCKRQHTTRLTHKNVNNPTGFEPAVTDLETRPRMWWAQFMFVFINIIIFSCLDSPSGPRPPLCGSLIIPRHTTPGRTSLGEWLSRRRNLYLTTRNTHNRPHTPRRDSNPQSQQASGRRPTP